MVKTKQNLTNNRIGETNINNQGLLMEIINYISYYNVSIKFEDGTIVIGRYDTFKKGQIKNKYYPSVYGVGIIGNGTVSINRKITKEYRMWHSMIQRCFSQLEKNKKPTYKDIKCCDEWLYFENFIKWMNAQDNYINNKDKNIQWHLDKDIILKNNKLYSPDTCCIVPQNVNSIFTSHSENNLPLGVSYVNKKYVSRCSDSNLKQVQLGTFDSMQEAFDAYKNMRLNVIKYVANNEYSKGLISKKCYEAMMNYSIDINDR